MALTWVERNLSMGSLFSNAIEDFFDNVLDGLTHWQIKGGGAHTNFEFDSGRSGGLIERVSDSKNFALHFNYNYAGQTDKFPGHYTIWQGFGDEGLMSDTFLLSAMMANAGAWTNKTDFFTTTPISILVLSSVTGNFQRGETVTIDSVGDNRTATVVDILPRVNNSNHTALILSGLSGAPTAAWNSKSVSGATSGASGTTASSTHNRVFMRHEAQSVFYLTGGDFPAVSNVLTGSTSGAVGTVSSVNAATGAVTFTTMTNGRFLIGETVTWSGPSSSTIAWSPRNQSQLISNYLVGSDPTIDTHTVLIGEDADRLVILIAQPLSSRYIGIMFGKWWESLEGGGRMDGVFVGDFASFRAGTHNRSMAVFLDHHGFPHANGSNASGTTHPNAKRWAIGEIQSMSSVTKHAYWQDSTTRETTETRRALRAHCRGNWDSTTYGIAIMPEFFFLPAQAWKAVEQAGVWGSAAPHGLHLENNIGFCIQFQTAGLSP